MVQRFPGTFNVPWPRRSKKVRLDPTRNAESLNAFEKGHTRIKSVLQGTRPATALQGKARSGSGGTGKPGQEAMNLN